MTTMEKDTLIPILQTPRDVLASYGLTPISLNMTAAHLRCTVNNLFYVPNHSTHKFGYLKDSCFTPLASLDYDIIQNLNG